MTTLSLEGVFAGALSAATMVFEPGLNVVLGATRDGTDTLARLAAGLERPRRGTLAVGDGAPWQSPELRARIGVVLADEPVVSAPSVLAWVARALALRTSRRSAESVLEEHGLSSIAPSRPERVPAEVRRHVALALALGIEEPLALVLHEPFAVGPLASRDATRNALVSAAEAGVCVLVLTASPRDASELGGRVVLLDGGRFVRRTGPSLSTELAPGQGIVLRVRTPEARKLLSRLAGEPAVSGVEWSDGEPPELTVRGSDAADVALAVMSAAQGLGAPIAAIEPVLPALDVARAASQGLWRAAYEAAYRQSQDHARARAGARVIAHSAAIGEPAPEATTAKPAEPPPEPAHAEAALPPTEPDAPPAQASPPASDAPAAAEPNATRPREGEGEP